MARRSTEAQVRDLKYDAKSCAEERGHRMSSFRETGKDSGVYDSMCKDCSRGVVARLVPMPNESDITGDAIEKNCTGTLTW